MPRPIFRGGGGGTARQFERDGLAPVTINKIRWLLAKAYMTEQMTAHGVRAMAATLLNKMGQWNPDAIERQLAHVDTNQVRRAYARGEYWDERVEMMQHWSDRLRDGGTVLRPDFKAARATG